MTRPVRMVLAAFGVAVLVYFGWSLGASGLTVGELGQMMRDGRVLGLAHALTIRPDKAGTPGDIQYAYIDRDGQTLKVAYEARGQLAMAGDMVLGELDEVRANSFYYLARQMQEIGLDEPDRARLQRMMDGRSRSWSNFAEDLGLRYPPPPPPPHYAVAWPDGELVYRIDPRVTNPTLKAAIRSAAAVWTQANVGVVVREYDPVKDARRWVFLEIVNPVVHPDMRGRNLTDRSWECSSYVGSGGRRRMYLTPACAGVNDDQGRVGVIVHEFGHALGFMHEHEREDRDLYLSGSDGAWTEFPKVMALGGLRVWPPYDPCSIMHYSPLQMKYITLSDRPGDEADGKGALRSCIAGMKRAYPTLPTDCLDWGQRCVPSPGDIETMRQFYARAAAKKAKERADYKARQATASRRPRPPSDSLAPSGGAPLDDPFSETGGEDASRFSPELH